MYVGITRFTVTKRAEEHFRSARSKPSFLLGRAIRRYGAKYFEFMELTRAANWKEACAQEAYWVEFYGTKAPHGYNMTKGGDGVASLCEEARIRHRNAMKGRPSPTKGKHLSEATREKIALSKIGKRLSHDHRQKLSTIAAGRTLSPEWRNHIGDAVRGTRFSEEHKQKIREANIATWQSPELRREMSERSLGRRPTLESRHRMSVSRRKRSKSIAGFGEVLSLCEWAIRLGVAKDRLWQCLYKEGKSIEEVSADRCRVRECVCGANLPLDKRVKYCSPACNPRMVTA
jgi:hypothetical protein